MIIQSREHSRQDSQVVLFRGGGDKIEQYGISPSLSYFMALFFQYVVYSYHIFTPSWDIVIGGLFPSSSLVLNKWSSQFQPR